MTSQGGGQRSQRDDAWQAVFGDVNDPTDPRFAADYAPPGPPPRRRAGQLRTALISIVALGAIIAVVAVFVARGNSTPDAGASVGAGITPSTDAAGSSSAAAATAAAQQDLRLQQALTVNTGWGQLAPYLANLASAGVGDACLTVTPANAKSCLFGAKPAAHHAVLVGDAAALDWMPAIVAELAPHGWDVQVLTEVNCPVSTVATTVNGAPDDKCADHHAFVKAELAAIHPALIFASDSPADLAYATAPPKPKNSPRQKSTDAFSDGVTSAVSTYRAYGKVVLIGSAPGGKAISQCQSSVSLPKACVSSVRTAWQAYQVLERNAAKGQADSLDPTAAFCHDDHCPAVVGTTAVYTNGVRMTAAWSKSLAYLFAAYVGVR